LIRKHYVNITSTPEFQISHYKERPWVPYVLEGCSDKEKAFINWMNRDILFAYEVREQCNQMGYQAFVNDGSISIDELVKKVRHLWTGRDLTFCGQKAKGLL
jgi:hypothetical protein